MSSADNNNPISSDSILSPSSTDTANIGLLNAKKKTGVHRVDKNTNMMSVDVVYENHKFLDSSDDDEKVEVEEKAVAQTPIYEKGLRATIRQILCGAGQQQAAPVKLTPAEIKEAKAKIHKDLKIKLGAAYNKNRINYYLVNTELAELAKGENYSNKWCDLYIEIQDLAIDAGTVPQPVCSETDMTEDKLTEQASIILQSRILPRVFGKRQGYKAKYREMANLMMHRGAIHEHTFTTMECHLILKWKDEKAAMDPQERNFIMTKVKVLEKWVHAVQKLRKFQSIQ